MSLFVELKRRNVFRMALLYLVASWLIMQVADVGISLLGLPDWTGRFVFLLLAIGLPLVLVFSWVYELTPEGLKRETEVDRGHSITGQTGHKLNVAIVVLLVLAVLGIVADRFLPETDVPPAQVSAEATTPGDQSIAVLPFVNMSSDPENEYFSDGLSEELLNLLAKIPSLQVAARTSAFSFKNSDAGIAEIAAALNVTHVLEGSVRKSGDAIRVTAQLIKAADGYHVWSHTWDRTLVDVFAIQDEIAAAVVDALKITLLGEVPTAPVTDPRAYDLYLQSKAAAALRNAEGYERATSLITESLAIDPDNAEAWAQLATIQVNQAGSEYVDPDEGFARARTSAERALKLEPRLAKALSTLGWIAMYHDKDFAKAATLIGQARRLEPGNASVLNASAVINGIFGRPQTMIDLYEEALARDPVAMSVLGNLAGAYLNNGRLDDAARMLERMREVEPASLNVTLFNGWLLQFTGKAQAAIDVFAAVEGPNGAWGLAAAYYDLGQDEESNAAIAELEEAGWHVQVAMLHAYRGEPDAAFESLNRGVDAGGTGMVETRMYGWFRVLYDDPRWEQVLARLGVSDADARRIGI